MTAEDKLALFLQSGAAPERDPVFVAETAARIARARLLWSFAAGLPWVVAATAVLWLLAPRLAPLAEAMRGELAPGLIGLAVAGASLIAGLWVARRA